MPQLEEFISELIVPEPGSGDVSAMSRGEPGVPQCFRWRDQAFQLAQVIQSWKTSSRDRGELYLRRHWFEILTTDGRRLTIYCQRQAASAKKGKSRWWLYKINTPTPS